MTLEERLARLEGRHRWLGRLFAVTLVGFASLLGVAAAAPEKLVNLVSDGWTVVGTDGKPVAEATNDGNLTVKNNLDVGNGLKVKGTDLLQTLTELKKPDPAHTQGETILASGYVTEDGNIARRSGAEFTVAHQATGIYEIIFSQKLSAVPVVVATSEGGPKGSDVRVRQTTNQSFRVEGRDYAGHGLANTGFGFIVVKAK